MLVTFEARQLPRSEADLGAGGGAVVSIGVFDGVHLGHQAILEANVQRAKADGAVPTVVTFRHHPKRVLLGNAPKTLTTLGHRLELFQRAGIRHAVALTFDERLRALDAEEFVEQICLQGLDARAFVLGFDSKFGRDRRGSPELLRKLGFDVEVVPKVAVRERAVSSTAIREAVELGDLGSAGAMLGRPVAVLGRVVRGAELGRELGFPTANLDLHHELHPPVGVYACRARLLDRPGEVLAGVANIGFRPTVGGDEPAAPVVEVHVLDFEGDLYGERVELAFVARLRGEQRFPSLDALVAQIGQDVDAARTRLAEPPPGSPVG